MGDLIFKEESYAIVGACLAVYREMGCGFLESVYQECLEIELTDREIPFVAQSALHLAYRGRPLNQRLQPDLICHGAIIVEVKAVSRIADEHRAQVLNYLHGAGLCLGLLVNFGHHPGLDWERLVLSSAKRGEGRAKEVSV